MIPSRINQNALIFSQLAQMKFKPSDCPLLQLNQQTHSQKLSQFQNQQSTLSHFFSSNSFNKRIKYLHTLNQNTYLIGNENQIDLISINGASYGFLQTDYLWSINLKELILNLSIDVKKCFLALVLQKFVHIYSYNSKKLNQIPLLIKAIETKNQVKFIQFAKESYLTIFYSQYFQIFIIQENGKIIKKSQKSYGLGGQYKIFAVPQAVDSVLNIFFQRQSEEEKIFSLWSMKVIFELVEVKTFGVSKVYDITKSLKKRVRIINYSRDTFLLNMGCEIIAAKKGFIIDSISINIQGEESRLIYLNNNKLVHINDDKVELYEIRIDLTVKPNRIRVKSIDSLEIENKPQDTKLLDVIGLGKDNFAIFYQLRPQYNIYRKGQVNYWFAITEYISIEQKIRKIFNYGNQISTLQPQIIQSRCDMARKLGLSQKQIFLQIWNRTSKNTINDYKYLLATKDFKTIYNQIQKKLKKQSMSYRQLINIFQSCLDILSKNVFSKESQTLCPQETIQEYLTCHLLVRKLKLFKEVEMHQRNNEYILTKSQSQDQSSLFMINIQSFYEYKNLDLKGYLIDHVNMFCNDKKNTIHKIRLILRAFRFIYRVIYRQLLDQIIANAKSNLLSLLQAIPQFLPHQHRVSQNEEQQLYQGIWKDISESQWSSNLYLQNIKTIDNSQKVDEVIKSVWYKRNWLTTHDLINKTKNQILSIHQKNNSQQIFYHFISTIFIKIENPRNIQVLIQFVQNFYQHLPSHIRGKIFLYVDLWKYYCQYHHQAKRNKMELNQFFMLKAPHLFKYFFDLQKVRKNCILKEIKPIYLRSKTQYPGLDVFNQGLLQYFESNLSQISDLKYLLNRMNNQKSQFHGDNADTYEILVQAMQIKLVIGGDNDIPIEQTLIYIENIPLSKDHDAMSELEIVQRINQQSQRFREMKLKMTIREIIDNCEDVIYKVIKYEFQKHQVSKIQLIGQLKRVSYSILAQVQTLKQKIYGDNMNNLPFFIYISQLLENQKQIELASELLKDQFLNRYFTVNQTVVQNLVLYMYKKRFSVSSVFRDHEKYVHKLLNLLPEDNNTREFIQSELEFALLLSSEKQPVRFPISPQHAFPKINQLIQIVNNLAGEFVSKVDIQGVYMTMKRMQQIEMVSAQDDQSQQEQYINTQLVSKHAVYEIFITRLINLKLVTQALNIIKKITQIDFPNKTYNTIYLIMLIIKISPQLNDESKQALINLVRFDFNQHQQIINIITFYVSQKITSLQKGHIITQQVNSLISNHLNYSISNHSLFKQAFIIEAMKTPKLQHNANLLIQSTWNHLKNTKPQFKNPLYQLIFIILCHQPYILAKLIYLQIQSINLKTLRSFISYLTVEEIFDEMKVLQFSKRIFYIVLQSRFQNQEINHRLFNFQRTPLDQNIHLRQYHHLTEENDLKLQKSIKACENKSKIILNPIKVSREKGSDNQSIQIKIHYPQNITQSSPSQYPYLDSDDDREQQDQSLIKKHQIKLKRTKIQFDQKSQRNKFMNREGKKLGNYMNQHTQTSKQSQSNTNQGFKSFKIKSRIASMTHQLFDKHTKIQKAMTLVFTPDHSRAKSNLLDPISHDIIENPKKRMILDLTPSPANSEQIRPQSPIFSQMKKKLSKRKSSQNLNSSIVRNEENAFMKNKQKQTSSYLVKDYTSIKQTQTYESIIEALLDQFDMKSGRFSLQKLIKRRNQLGQNPLQFKKQLQSIIRILFDNIENETQIRMGLIKSIVSYFNQTGVKMNILSVYLQFINLVPKYNLNISVENIIPIDDLFKDQSLSELFKSIKSKIIEISTLQNLSKLSKVISLAFGKNIYEQQIAYLGLCKILNQLQTSPDLDQVEVNLYFDQINQIITKISTKMFRQKGEQQFSQISNGPLKDRLIQRIITVITNKGDKISVNALKKSMKIN